MNQDLTDIIHKSGIEFDYITKSDKVRLLSRWSSIFAPLIACARKGHRVSTVYVDNAADELLEVQRTGAYYLLPDDDSGMSSVRCLAHTVPNLTALLSDTYTKCDEIVIVDAELAWSYVLVNHGTAGVGRYFMQASSKMDGP